MLYDLVYFSKRTIKLDNGCLKWTGPIYRNGYSKLANTTAHRVMFELVKSKIPSGFHVDHLCRNKLCINPDHLEAVTPKENTIRHTSLKTHCIRGHELFGQNLYMTPNGRRQCKQCRANATGRWFCQQFRQ